MVKVEIIDISAPKVQVESNDNIVVELSEAPDLLTSDPLMPSICLNMIVKNESRVIHRLLHSVAPWIDSYCICDTGSTDNTVDLIETFFKDRLVPGKVVCEPFQDFGYNRTFALNACLDAEKADYLLLLDADMVLWVDPNLTKAEFKKMMTYGDSHYIVQGTEQFYYKNVRCVKNRFGFSYWGVTHEYVNAPPHTKYHQFDKSSVFIRDIGDGGSKADKFLRDIRLLTKGLEENPNNDRYTFYLANSYKDSGQLDEAIETYKKRIAIGGWHEEVWYSHYNIGICYKHKGDMANAVFWWMEAYQFVPDRIENLYEIVTHYRQCGKNRLSYPFCILAKNEIEKKRKLDYLFLQRDIYDYKMDYELSIIGYYCNTDGADLAAVSMKVLAYPFLEDAIRQNVMSNYKFYAKDILPLSSSDQDKSLVQGLKYIGAALAKEFDPIFVSTTPCIIQTSDKEVLCCVRYVNYRVGEHGEYINQDHIETKNIVASFQKIDDGVWRKTSEFVLEYDTSHDNHYVGLEDVRLFYDSASGKTLYNANRGLDRGSMVIETGTVDLEKCCTASSVFLEKGGQNTIEKNWVYLPCDSGKKMIYGWHPLTIGDVNENLYEKTHEIDTPSFFKQLRGSTNGILVDDELWFICHAVSYEDRRYYYHIMVVLDKDTFQLKRYTPYFTMQKEKVEYTLGFIYQKETKQFLIGYSILDRTTEYKSFKKSVFDEMMICREP